MVDPAGMAQGELKGRGCACGEGGHVGAGDLERVQQCGERVGLTGGGGAGRQRRAEVAEPGRGDHPAAGKQVAHRHQRLVAAAENGVDGQQRLAGAAFGVFHRAGRGLDCRPVGGHPAAITAPAPTTASNCSLISILHTVLATDPTKIGPLTAEAKVPGSSTGQPG
jgi:hypothetical protein